MWKGKKILLNWHAEKIGNIQLVFHSGQFRSGENYSRIEARNDHGKWLGGAIYSHGLNEVYIRDLEVEKKHNKSGLGSSLLAFISAHEGKPVSLRTTPASIGFYKHLGLKPHPTEIGESWFENPDQLTPQKWVAEKTKGKLVRKFYIEKESSKKKGPKG